MPYKEEGKIGYAIACPRLASPLGGNCTRAGQRRRGDEDDAGWALKMCAAEERRCAAPASWTSPLLQGISKDLGL